MEIQINSKLYEKLRTNTEAVQQKMVEAEKNECANALKEVKRLCKEFDFKVQPSRFADCFVYDFTA